MKIAYFTDTYYPEINGVVTSISIFTRKLREAGVDLTIYAPYYRGIDPVADHKNGVRRMMSFTPPLKEMEYQRLSYPWLNDGRSFFGFLREIKREQYDLIHIQVQGTMGVIGLLTSRLCRVPAVHTYHTMFIEYVHYVPEFMHWFGRRAVKWLSRLYAGRCEFTVCPSVEIRDELRTYHVAENMEIIPTGLDCRDKGSAETSSEIRRQWKIPEEKKILGFVGRLAQEKNVEFLLDTVLQLRKEREDFVFLIVGGGPYSRNLIEEASRLGVDGYTIFTDFVSPDVVKNYYYLMDLFIFSSETETQGLCVLEAMAAGVPYVAVDAMGVSSIIEGGKAGIGVRPGDQPSFLAAIRRMLDDDAFYRRKKAETKERIIDFGCEPPVDDMIDMYERAIVKNRYKWH